MDAIGRSLHMHYMSLLLLSTIKDAEHWGVLDPQTASPASKPPLKAHDVAVHARYTYICTTYMSLLLLSTIKSTKHRGVLDHPQTA